MLLQALSVAASRASQITDIELDIVDEKKRHISKTK